MNQKDNMNNTMANFALDYAAKLAERGEEESRKQYQDALRKRQELAPEPRTTPISTDVQIVNTDDGGLSEDSLDYLNETQYVTDDANNEGLGATLHNMGVSGLKGFAGAVGTAGVGGSYALGKLQEMRQKAMGVPEEERIDVGKFVEYVYNDILEVGLVQSGLDSAYTDAYKNKLGKMQKMLDGIEDKPWHEQIPEVISFYAENIGMIPVQLAEVIPRSILEAGGYGKLVGLGLRGAGVGTRVAGGSAIGGTFAYLDQVREEGGADGLNSGTTARDSLLVGGTTGLITSLGSRLPGPDMDRIGVGRQAATGQRGIIAAGRNTLRGGRNEFIEEALQNPLQNMAYNHATGEPVFKDVGTDVAMGGILGFGAGSVTGAFSSIPTAVEGVQDTVSNVKGKAVDAYNNYKGGSIEQNLDLDDPKSNPERAYKLATQMASSKDSEEKAKGIEYLKLVNSTVKTREAELMQRLGEATTEEDKAAIQEELDLFRKEKVNPLRAAIKADIKASTAGAERAIKQAGEISSTLQEKTGLTLQQIQERARQKVGSYTPISPAATGSGVTTSTAKKQGVPLNQILPKPDNAVRSIIVSLVGTESGGVVSAEYINKDGRRFGGLIQMGDGRLQDYANATKTKAIKAADFKNLSAEQQTKINEWHINDLITQANKTGAIGKEIKGTKVTLGGLVAMAHLGGVGGMREFVRTNGAKDPQDALGTKLSDYLAKHASSEDFNSQRIQDLYNAKGAETSPLMVSVGAPAPAAPKYNFATPIDSSKAVEYRNNNAGTSRNEKLSSNLESTIKKVLAPMGIKFAVYSGGQSATSNGTAGGPRHNDGNAADGDFYIGDRQLDWSKPEDLKIFEAIVEELAANGVTGIGGDLDYMGTARLHIGFGGAATWGGKNGKGAAPKWMQDAHKRGLERAKSGNVATPIAEEAETQESNISFEEEYEATLAEIDQLLEEHGGTEQEKQEVRDSFTEAVRKTKLTLSSMTDEDIDNNPILSEGQKAKLRELTQFKRALADKNTVAKTRDNIITGFRGSKNSKSHLGLRDYDAIFTEAIATDDVDTVNQHLAYLARFRDNHVSKANLINELIAQPNRTSDITIAAEANTGEWMVINKSDYTPEQLEAARTFDVPVRHNKGTRAINEEVQMIDQALTAWSGASSALMSGVQPIQAPRGVVAPQSSPTSTGMPSNTYAPTGAPVTPTSSVQPSSVTTSQASQEANQVRAENVAKAMQTTDKHMLQLRDMATGTINVPAQLSPMEIQWKEKLGKDLSKAEVLALDLKEGVVIPEFAHLSLPEKRAAAVALVSLATENDFYTNNAKGRALSESNISDIFSKYESPRGDNVASTVERQWASTFENQPKLYQRIVQAEDTAAAIKEISPRISQKSLETVVNLVENTSKRFNTSTTESPTSRSEVEVKPVVEAPKAIGLDGKQLDGVQILATGDTSIHMDSGSIHKALEVSPGPSSGISQSILENPDLAELETKWVNTFLDDPNSLKTLVSQIEQGVPLSSKYVDATEIERLAIARAADSVIADTTGALEKSFEVTTPVTAQSVKEGLESIPANSMDRFESRWVNFFKKQPEKLVELSQSENLETAISEMLPGYDSDELGRVSQLAENLVQQVAQPVTNAVTGISIADATKIKPSDTKPNERVFKTAKNIDEVPKDAVYVSRHKDADGNWFSMGNTEPGEPGWLANANNVEKERRKTREGRQEMLDAYVSDFKESFDTKENFAEEFVKLKGKDVYGFAYAPKMSEASFVADLLKILPSDPQQARELVERIESYDPNEGFTLAVKGKKAAQESAEARRKVTDADFGIDMSKRTKPVSDDSYEAFKGYIDEQVSKIKQDPSGKFELPTGGLGLDIRMTAPKSYAYLNKVLKEELGLDNEAEIKANGEPFAPMSTAPGESTTPKERSAVEAHGKEDKSKRTPPPIRSRKAKDESSEKSRQTTKDYTNEYVITAGDGTKHTVRIKRNKEDHSVIDVVNKTDTETVVTKGDEVTPAMQRVMHSDASILRLMEGKYKSKETAEQNNLNDTIEDSQVTLNLPDGTTETVSEAEYDSTYVRMGKFLLPSEMTKGNPINLEEALELYGDGIESDVVSEKERLLQLSIINPMLAYNPDLKIIIQNKEGESKYNKGKNTIYLRLPSKGTVLQEIARMVVHSGTFNLVQELDEYGSSPLELDDSSQMANLVRSLNATRREISRQISNPKSPYSQLDDKTKLLITEMLSSNQELINIGLSDPKVIKFLRSSGLKNKGYGRTSLYRRIVDSIKGFFNIGSNKEIHTHFDLLLDTTSRIVAEQARDKNVSFEAAEDARISIFRDYHESLAEAEFAKNFYSRNQLLAGFTQNSSKGKPLSSVPNLVSKLRADLMQGLSKLNSKVPTKAQRQQIEDFLGFHEEIREHLLATYAKKNTSKNDEGEVVTDFGYQDFKSYLSDEAGNIDENTLSAVSLALYDWSIEFGNKELASDKDIKKFLNVDPDEEANITPEIYQQYKHFTGLKSYSVASLGKHIVQSLGLQTNENASVEAMSKLESSLGEWAISALQTADLIHISTMPTYQHFANIEFAGGKSTDRRGNELLEFSEATKDGYGQISFIGIVDTNGKNYNPRLAEITKASKRTHGYMGEVFGNEVGLKRPSLVKPEDVNVEIPRSSAILSSAQAEHIKIMQEEPIAINVPMFEVLNKILEVDRESALKMLGAHVSKEELAKLHKMDRSSKEASSQGNLRDLENAIDFAHSLQKTKSSDSGYQLEHFYDTTHGAKNNRMHYDAASFNFQSSKVHRAMGEYANFIAEVDLKGVDSNGNFELYDEDGKPNPLTLFFRAIAENAEGTEKMMEKALEGTEYEKGFTVDKVSSKEFVPAFVNYLRTDSKVLTAVESMQKLLNDPKTFSKADLANVNELVNEWDMGTNSLRALVEYTQFVTALENGTPLTTSLGLGSDGINNGTALSQVSFGTADDKFLTQVGFLLKDGDYSGLNDYFDSRKIPGIGDYYEGLVPFVKNVMEDLRESDPRLYAEMEKFLAINNNFFERKAMKNILIPFGYSAGLDRIRSLAFGQFLSDLKGQLEDLAHADTSTNENIAKYNHDHHWLQQSLSELTGTEVKLPHGKDLLEFWPDQSQVISLKNMYVDTLGKVMEDSLAEYAKDFIRERDFNVAIQGSAYDAYEIMHDAILERGTKQYKEFLKTQETYKDVDTKKLTLDEWLDRLIATEGIPKQYYDKFIGDELKSVLPTLKTPYNANEGQLDESSPSDFVLAQEGSDMKADQFLSADNRRVDAEGKLRVTKTQLQVRKKTVEDVGLSGNSNQVQGLDAFIAGFASALGGKVNINVHDAAISGILNYIEMGQMQNMATYRGLRDYHAQTFSFLALSETLQKLVDYYAEGTVSDAQLLNNITRTLDRIIGFEAMAELEEEFGYNRKDVTPEVYYNKVVEPTLQIILEKISNTEKRKFTLLRRIDKVQQYGGEGSEYVVTEADIKLIDEQERRVKEVHKNAKNNLKGISDAFKKLDIDSDVKPGDKPGKVKGFLSVDQLTNFTGGAYGADTFFDIVGRQFGVQNHVHFRPEGNTNLSRDLRNLMDSEGKTLVKPVILTRKELASVLKEVETALGRKLKPGRGRDMQLRNYFQVKNADSVFAVATLHGNRKRVDGGTNTAVTLSVKQGKPTYVWDLKTEKWFAYNPNTKVFEEFDGVPKLTPNFAGVGSRDIQRYSVPHPDTKPNAKSPIFVEREATLPDEKSSAAMKAIADVYANTLGVDNTPETMLEDRIPEVPKVAVQYFTRESADNDPSTLYIFTDNLARSSGPEDNNIPQTSPYYTTFVKPNLKEGHVRNISYPYTTQAQVRGLSNAMPISTKVNVESQFQDTDQSFELFKQTVDMEIEYIVQAVSQGAFTSIKYSAEGYMGNNGGKAALPQRHFEYLTQKLREIGIDNYTALGVNTRFNLLPPEAPNTPVPVQLQQVKPVKVPLKLSPNTGFPGFLLSNTKDHMVRMINTLQWDMTQKNRPVFQFGSDYKYSNRVVKGHDMNAYPGMQEIVDQVNLKLGTNFNGVLVNWYPAGMKSGIGKHKDNEPEIVKGSPVASISLGADTTFILEGNGEKKTVTLKDGELFLMGENAQEHYTHSIPFGTMQSDRVSLTFREFHADEGNTPNTTEVTSSLSTEEKAEIDKVLQATNGVYEVSSAGDTRFSALFAQFKDGRFLEEIYQKDVKGNGTAVPRTPQANGRIPTEGAKKTGKPSNGIAVEESIQQYTQLWYDYLMENPKLGEILNYVVNERGATLNDKFVSKNAVVSQADSLMNIARGNFTAKQNVQESTDTQVRQDELAVSEVVKGLLAKVKDTDSHTVKASLKRIRRAVDTLKENNVGFTIEQVSKKDDMPASFSIRPYTSDKTLSGVTRTVRIYAPKSEPAERLLDRIANGLVNAAATPMEHEYVGGIPTEIVSDLMEQFNDLQTLGDQVQSEDLVSEIYYLNDSLASSKATVNLDLSATGNNQSYKVTKNSYGNPHVDIKIPGFYKMDAENMIRSLVGVLTAAVEEVAPYINEIDTRVFLPTTLASIDSEVSNKELNKSLKDEAKKIDSAMKSLVKGFSTVKNIKILKSDIRGETTEDGELVSEGVFYDFNGEISIVVPSGLDIEERLDLIAELTGRARGILTSLTESGLSEDAVIRNTSEYLKIASIVNTPENLVDSDTATKILDNVTKLMHQGVTLIERAISGRPVFGLSDNKKFFYYDPSQSDTDGFIRELQDAVNVAVNNLVQQPGDGKFTQEGEEFTFKSLYEKLGAKEDTGSLKDARLAMIDFFNKNLMSTENKRVFQPKIVATNNLKPGQEGYYNAKTHTVHISRDILNSNNMDKINEVVLHEMVHAYSARVVFLIKVYEDAGGSIDKVPAEYREAYSKIDKGTIDSYRKLEKMRETLKAHLEKRDLSHKPELQKSKDFLVNTVLSDINEFIAYGLTRGSVQTEISEVLKTLNDRNILNLGDLESTKSSRFRNFFGNFIQEVFGFFKNFYSTNRTAKEVSDAYHTFARLADDLINVPTKEDVDLFNAVFKDKELILNSFEDPVASLGGSPKQILGNLSTTGISQEHNKQLNEVFAAVEDYHNRGVNQENQIIRVLSNIGNDAILAGFRMTDKEVYAYEIVRSIGETFLKENAGEKAALVYMDMFKKITDESVFTDDVFLSDPANATPAERAEARRKRLFITRQDSRNQEEQFERFLAMSVASEEFRKVIDKIDTSHLDTVQEETWFERAMGIYSTMMDWLSDKTLGIGGMSNSDSLSGLFLKLTEINQSAAAYQSGTLDKAYDAVLSPVATSANFVGDKLFNGLFTVFGGAAKLTGNPTLKVLAETAENTRKAGIDTVANTYLGNQALHSKQDGMAGRLNEFGELVSEFTAYTGMKKTVEGLVRMTNKEGQERQVRKQAATNKLQELFKDYDNTPAEQIESVTRVGLKTDISSLLNHGKSVNDAIRMMIDDNARNNEIKRLEQYVMENHTEYNDMLIQSKALAIRMGREENPEHLVLNADNIAIGLGSWYQIERSEMDTQLRDVIDQLVSLYAVGYTSSEQRDHMKALVRSDREAVKGVLKYSQQLAEKSKRDFEDNPYNYIKGYLPEETNHYRSLMFALNSDDIERMQAEGWEILFDKDLGQDVTDTTDTRTLMFHRDIAYQDYVSGALDMKDTHSKGTVVYDRTTYDDLERVTLVKLKRRRERNRTSFRDYKGEYDTDSNLVANYDSDGYVLNYRYEMSGKLRDQFLERNNNAVDILSIHESDLHFKPKIAEAQRNVASALYEDYMENYADNPEEFVILDPESTDPEVVKMWRMMPYAFREHAVELFGQDQPIVVRSKVFTPVFGFKKYGIGEIFEKSEGDRNPIEKLIHWLFTSIFDEKAQTWATKVDRFYKSGVKEIKDWIVIRNADVLIGNVVANAAILAMHGVNPMQQFKDFVFVWRNGGKYRKQALEIAEIDVALSINRGRPAELRKLNRRRNLLMTELEKNPMHPYMEAGLMSTIVEDTNFGEEQTRYKSDFEVEVDKYLEYIPGQIRTTYEWATMGKSTPMHKFMGHATQFSDLAAKYSLANKLMKKDNFSFEDAITEAQGVFINYDVPSGRGMDAMNSYGLFMFTKFFVRFQHALNNVLEKKAGAAIAQHMALEHFTDFPGVLEPLAINNIGNPLHPGILKGSDAFADISTISFGRAILGF